MELKFIGTGSGKTSLKRYHSSFLINSGEYNLLVDAGDGVSRALINQKILFNFINGILISHLHPDHYTGLPSLIVQMKMNNRESPLDIFCEAGNFEFLKEFIYQSFLFEGKLGFKLNVKSFGRNEALEITDGFGFSANQNSHLNQYINFDTNKRLTFPCSSFLLNVKQKNIFYTGDIGEYKDLFLFEGNKIDIMISEITHIKTDELLEAFRRLKPEKLFLTHLSEEDEAHLSKLSFQLPAAERRKVIAAFDGLNVKI
jgi:ribonuclease BN (tRNA processing enzyme)